MHSYSATTQSAVRDFNQNARDRTMASAYSVCCAPATASMPLTWEELATANPDEYIMATVSDLVRRREGPWATMAEVAQSIGSLLEMAEADEERGLGNLPDPPNYSPTCRANPNGCSRAEIPI